MTCTDFDSLVNRISLTKLRKMRFYCRENFFARFYLPSSTCWCHTHVLRNMHVRLCKKNHLKRPLAYSQLHLRLRALVVIAPLVRLFSVAQSCAWFDYLKTQDAERYCLCKRGRALMFFYFETRRKNDYCYRESRVE